MKKIYILLLTIVSFNFLNAQLSSKHWLPPIHSRDNTAIEDHYLYLSTQETTPFQVTIRRGDGTVVGMPVTISAATPAQILIGNGEGSEMFIPRTKLNAVQSTDGLIVEGSRDFYASFRMRAANHAEIIVSKGIPGIGTEFRLGSTPQGGDLTIRNFVASVMATENNTQINLSEYNPNVEFASAGANITADTQTFTLNAGQTIVFSGYTDVAANYDGFIGAKLTATKPVAVNSGNALAGVTAQGSDFTLDQIVSTSQIGSEYIFIEGNGNASMERPLIIANENGTDVFVNGSATPLTTLNAGQYIFIDNFNYQGTNVANQNIYVKSSKPVYAYQLIGGGPTNATSGLNFIPPLSCFFQSSVVLPSVDRIGNTQYTSDLMVLTYSNATINVNGVAIPTSSSQAVLGNVDWVTYRIQGVSGDANVTSTGPIAVGIFGYNTNAGFAGYFSGFGSNPRDTDVQVCSSIPKNIFDAINGNPGPGGTWAVPMGGAPIVNNIFNPTVNIPGEYIYTFSKACNTSNATISVKVNVSIVQAKNPGTSIVIPICKNDTARNIFTQLGAGTTAGGNWTPALPTGGNFDPSQFMAGTYFYKYTLAEELPCPELSSTVTFNVIDIPVIQNITNFELCDDNSDGSDINGLTTFNLTTKNTEVLTGLTNHTVKYYLSLNDAKNDVNAILSYTGATTTIYVRVINSTTNCYNTSSFQVIVNPKPTVVNIVTLRQCDDDTDGISIFNLNEANDKISTQMNLTFDYFTTAIAAQNNDISQRILDYTSLTSGSGNTVWARITNQFGCFRTAQVNLIVSATQVPSTFSITLEECDQVIGMLEVADDGSTRFNLTPVSTAIIALLPVGQNLTVSYYLTETDALQEENKITDITNFRNTIPNFQELWVRVDSDIQNDCVGLGQFVDLVVNPRPDFSFDPLYNICVNAQTGVGTQPLDATPITPGNYSYTWTPTNPNLDAFGNQASVFNVTQAGNYSVTVVNTTTNCQKTLTTEVKVSSPPVSVIAQLLTPLFSEGTATVQAIVSGGFGVYEYSINNGLTWQDSNVFSGLENGTYQIIVRDKANCGQITSNAVVVVTYPPFFTPNADGYNDTWNITGLDPQYQAKLYIFDKYGKFIKQLSPNGSGWDGTFNNEPLPSTDYWFRLEYVENNENKDFKSHFSLKR